MHIVQVTAAHDTYPIYIGENLLHEQAERVLSHLNGQQVLLVTDPTVASYYGQIVKDVLKDYQTDEVMIAVGEASKSLATLATIWDTLLAKRHRRDTTIIALGGGVVGDVAGFAAACYQRGVAYIQIPTTLLAQVDSAIGGKTAINYRLGKNMLGAFHQPRCVLADISTLKTLPTREFNAGMAEVIKYALIVDSEFFAWLEKHTPVILAREPRALIHIVERCCLIKARTIAVDTYDQQQRLLLNYGHTFAHAIESAMAYQQYHHGEAVAIGMNLAASYSQQKGWLTEFEVQRIIQLLEAYGLPIKIPAEISLQDMLDFIMMDKKMTRGMLRLVLLQHIGQALVEEEIDCRQLHQILKAGYA